MLMWLHAGTPERKEIAYEQGLPSVGYQRSSFFYRIISFLLKERHCGYPTRFQMCNHCVTTILTPLLL